MKEEFPELERLVELSRRYPQLARAVTSDTPAIAAAVAKRTDADLRFLTRTVDSPTVIEGYLDGHGVWRVSRCHFVVDARCEDRLEDAIVADAADEFFVAMESLAEQVIRWAISRYLANAPLSEGCAAFERRLSTSRFSPNLVLH
jgi:hypothetical protein